MTVIRKSGFGELAKKLEELDGTHQLTFSELFPDEFMLAHTKVASMQELLDKSGFRIESMEDFVAIPDVEWDQYIQENTDFDTWEEMQKVAVSAWAQKKLSFT